MIYEHQVFPRRPIGEPSIVACTMLMDHFSDGILVDTICCDDSKFFPVFTFHGNGCPPPQSGWVAVSIADSASTMPSKCCHCTSRMVFVCWSRCDCGCHFYRHLWPEGAGFVCELFACGVVVEVDICFLEPHQVNEVM